VKRVVSSRSRREVEGAKVAAHREGRVEQGDPLRHLEAGTDAGSERGDLQIGLGRQGPQHARDAAAGTARVSVAAAGADRRRAYFTSVLLALGLLMLLALGRSVRRRPAPVALGWNGDLGPTPEDLARRIAALDASFQRRRAPSVEERAVLVRTIAEHWGDDSPENPLASVVAGDDERLRRAMARAQRLAMSPAAAAAALSAIGETDVRDVLPSVQCPTLVLRLEHDQYLDERHSRYVAEHVPDADYVQVPGDGAFWIGSEDAVADEIQHFLTGVRRPVISDRVLATVLFTDIVGSTERAAELGDGPWRALLARHDALVREEVERHRGRFVKSLGDGALAVFDGPSRAISCAAAVRDRVRELELEIRAGLHTGECELMPDDDVGGLAVHIGARVSGLAGPGEVLASSTVRDLVVGSGQTLTDRGEHELKGVPGPWRIFAVAD